MTTFACTDLRKWREAQQISAADLAERISCTTETLYRYESGKIKPNPDVMWQICDALGDTDVWTNWMRTEYPASYGRKHPAIATTDMKTALMNAFTEIEEAAELRKAAIKDGADGRIDDDDLGKAIEKEFTEMIQAAQRVLTLLKGR